MKRQESHLKPLAVKRDEFRHGAFDIESNEWTQFEMGGVFDGREYIFCPDIGSLVETLIQKRNRGRTFFAHNGGKFDFLFLFSELERREIPARILCQGARIVQLKILLSDRHYITLQDSFSILPHALQTLSDSFEPEHRKIKDGIDFEKERVSKDNPAHREYLKNDVLCLYEVIEKYKRLPFIRDVGVRLTLASTSLAAWRTTLGRKIRVTPPQVQKFVRRSYAGGRCEIFRQVMGHGAMYDVNSLYPTMMRNRALPVEYLGKSNDVSDFGFHSVTVRVPEMHVPPLWIKTPKLIFPTGKITGTYFSEELKAAIELGCVVEKHHAGMAFTSSRDLFTSFIDDCYRLRLEHPDSAISLTAKGLMNNCYGKTAEREEKKSLEKVDPKDPGSWPDEFTYFHSERMFKRTGFIITRKYSRSPHMLCHIASAITAYGRIHMLQEYYAKLGENLAYTDTDSVACMASLQEGGGLGELKREYGIKSAFFLVPKGYFIELPEIHPKYGREIKKLKGFSKKSLESITYDLFKSGNISSAEKKIATLKTALIRKNDYLALVESRKSILSVYSKRKLLKGGFTRAWVYKNGELK